MSGSCLGLVGLGGVEGELGEELAVVIDNPGVVVGGEDEDAGADVAAADAEVAQLGLVSQRDLASLVDAVAPDPVVGGDHQAEAARVGFGAGGPRGGGGAPAEGPMGTDGVVVGAEAVELGLEGGDGRGPRLFGEPLLEGLVEPLDLAAGLGVVGAGVFEPDAQGGELGLEQAAAPAALGGEDGAVECR